VSRNRVNELRERVNLSNRKSQGFPNGNSSVKKQRLIGVNLFQEKTVRFVVFIIYAPGGIAAFSALIARDFEYI
ncbi:MAG: hypothetical protein ACSW76_02695, partial [Bacteroidaceae bacterium]